jgi:outer membrane protein W
MKKFFTLLLTVIIMQSAVAQAERVFKKFKTDISLGYAIAQGSGSQTGTKGGVLFAIEPKYAVLDALSVGLRMEAAVTANVDINGEKGSAKANASYLITGDYYFTDKKFRPFGGVGAGMFTTASVDESTTATTAAEIPTASKFGFMTRAGFEYGHLRIGAEYNFVANKAGYLGIKIGACIGGGRKK